MMRVHGCTRGYAYSAVRLVMGCLTALTMVGSGVSVAAEEPAAPVEQELANPDDLDDLLALAEEDIGRLGQISVAAPALQMEVSTVSRQVSTVGRSAAAVFVITNEMIHRSGARSIPEVLRLAPGVNVARLTGNRWAVSIRGFNDVYANKLLVQIDGRSLYTPLFAGVYWDHQGVVLEDVERIEVIRGPGATVWGANAVNGVINIITKKASDTQGTLIQAGGGTEERSFGTARYGGQAGESLHYRVYGQEFERDGGYRPDGGANDQSRRGQFGARMDWEPNPCTTVTLQSDYFQGVSGNRFDELIATPPFVQPGVESSREPSGWNMLGRVTHELDADSDWSVQMYYDRDSRFIPYSGFVESRDTFDLDFQHRFRTHDRHSLIWGFGYRNTRDLTEGIYRVNFEPPIRSFGRISYFVQDEIELKEDLLFLTLGSKFEHNDFSRFEYQPTARLLWTPTDRHVMWGSISRAVRTPARLEQDARILGAPLVVTPGSATFLQVDGSRDTVSEELLAYELGFRAQPTESFSWDFAAFFNNYDKLILFEPVSPFPAPASPPSTWNAVAINAAEGQTYGFELAATWDVNPCWKLQGGYSFLRMHLDDNGRGLGNTKDAEGRSPRNQFYLWSSWDVGCDWSLDVMGRYVDRLSALDVSNYFVSDIRLAWRPTCDLELALVGRNLLDSHHAEFDSSSTYSSEVEQEAYGMVTWRF